MRLLRWQVRALSDPRYVDTAILRLSWTLQALANAEVETARALVAGLHAEWEQLRERCVWQVERKEGRS
jgi:hypothetical protein